MSEKKKPTAFERLCANVEKVALRWRDMTAFQNQRLAEIENRLARIDGGDDAEAARRAALSDANLNRVSAGQEPLGFSLVEVCGEPAVKWK